MAICRGRPQSPVPCHAVIRPRPGRETRNSAPRSYLGSEQSLRRTQYMSSNSRLRFFPPCLWTGPVKTLSAFLRCFASIWACAVRSTIFGSMDSPHRWLHFYTAHFTLHTALCRLHTALCKLHAALCRLHTALYTLHFASYTLPSASYTLHSASYTLHSASYTLHHASCTL